MILNKQILAGLTVLLAFGTIQPIQGFPIKDLNFYVNRVLMSIERRFRYFIESDNMSSRMSFFIESSFETYYSKRDFMEAQGGI
jgi:hypothetical protein